MQGNSYPERDVVLVGGGHTHALVMRKWGMAPLPNVRLTLINPGPFPPYSGMLPGFVAGHYSQADMVMDLVPLARFAGARLILDAATGIEPLAKRIHLQNRPSIQYDTLSFDVGIHAKLPAIEGFSEHGTPVKPFASFVADWQKASTAMIAGDLPPQIAVIGGGVAGVELALSMQFRLAQHALNPLITIIEMGDSLLSSAHPRTRRYLFDALAKAGIATETNAQVSAVSPQAVTLSDGRLIPAALTVSAAGARPHSWLAGADLPNENGYLTTRSDLSVEGHSSIFAVGDCAHFAPDPRPKAGVFAVRQAPTLFHNLQALVTGRPTRDFKPQSNFLKLVSTGSKDAIAERGPLVFRHPLLWRWKDRIDQNFMRQFKDLPDMPEEDAPPLCGGCGAKVGQGLLEGETAKLPRPVNPNILSRPGDDAAIIERSGTREVLTTDHLRAFTNDTWLMARIAAVHALGDIWAMGATPEAVLVNLILPRAHPRIHARMLEEVMSGIGSATEAAKADIVGGHTTEGAELTIGLTITGLTQRPITLEGAKPGDVLVLTKPIGTGTLLAGEMERKTQGDWLAEAYTSMIRPMDRASGILAPQAHAMTDVTGFGLAGHIAAMMAASGTSAEIALPDVPLLPGALELAQMGVRSSLFEANAAKTPMLGDHSEPFVALMHDPQTAGGLLAALPPEVAADVVSRLLAAGETAQVIGKVTRTPGDGALVSLCGQQTGSRA